MSRPIKTITKAIADVLDYIIILVIGLFNCIYHYTVRKLVAWYCDRTSERVRGWVAIILSWVFIGGLAAAIAIWLMGRR